ncbi:hypothetical protein [Moorena sp. SIO3H5]|uniref:hypothetical protein n=1 Tax=Moorena sp. SIO3H5 TaxID=2607834 RepID=UPI0013BD4FBB|nr:hypothetical protein [Moorena sp. SIO3H5]NEO72330.1 hypothetical protein [Moorena sp. SIO3H5]
MVSVDSEQVTVIQVETLKRHIITVTVTLAEDIKVNQDDRVNFCEVLADRTAEGQRLEAKGNQLKIPIEQISLPMP